jgi:hypothetical protein
MFRISTQLSRVNRVAFQTPFAHAFRARTTHRAESRECNPLLRQTF